MVNAPATHNIVDTLAIVTVIIQIWIGFNVFFQFTTHNIIIPPNF